MYNYCCSRLLQLSDVNKNDYQILRRDLKTEFLPFGRMLLLSLTDHGGLTSIVNCSWSIPQPSLTVIIMPLLKLLISSRRLC